MKGKLISITAGIAAVAALAALPSSALASDGRMTLNVNPIDVVVNGEVFQPKDSQGRAVEVFVTDAGTTYAPVRALAEAYGLTVGYDPVRNLVTVSAPAESLVPTDFASQWAVKQKPVTHYGDEKIYTATYCGNLGMSAFKAWWKSLDLAYIQAEAEQLAAEMQRMDGGRATVYFDFNGYALGTAYAFGDFEQSNFDLATIWIK